MTIAELIIGCLLVLMVVTLGDWTFKDIALFAAAASLNLFFFVLLVVRRRKGRLLFLTLAAVFLIVLVVRLPVLFPLRTHIRGRAFHDAPLERVLQHISAQRQEWPRWRFEVYDERAAKETVTVTIPQNCTLRQALDCIAQAIQCDYDWVWHKACGNEPTPGCATFRLWRPGNTITSLSDYFLFVDGHDVWKPERAK
jgi:hypothetical protein